ncbi:pilus assembly PilX family protein [Gilvimarinus sp. F26214L]|uniref:pilus assembly PilX family protein n=1 Tax=Gilvimarinus sp. DZF01 TaxID=3461371 RepID=UPI0040467758
MRTIKREQGAVLIVALVFLLLTAMISATVMQTSVLEVRMAGNEQLREEAFQRVHAVANAITADANNLVVTGDIGYRICATGVGACDSASIALDSAITDVPNGVTLNYHAERLAPLFAPLPFRMSEANAGSASVYSAALFEIDARYEGSAAGLGRSHIAQGIAVRVANNGQ